jgi:hypothetical protein
MNHNIKIAVFWDVVPCCLADVDQRFSRAYYFHNQSDEAVSSSETSVNICQTALSEDSHIHTLRRENLKSHALYFVTKLSFVA